MIKLCLITGKMIMNFGLGQSVKLVLPIIDAFYDKTLKHTVTVV